MARVAAAKKKKPTKRKSGLIINKNTYIRRNSTSSSSRVGESIISTGEIIFLVAGVGLGILAWQMLKPKTTTTTTTTGSEGQNPDPAPDNGVSHSLKANVCTIPNETVERRINGGCGCSNCKKVSGSKFNFVTESF